MSPKTKNMLLRLPPELADQLQAVADVEERPVSEVVREAIRRLVADRRRDADFQAKLTRTARRYEDVLDRLRHDEDDDSGNTAEDPA
jgi:predicted DNA-binding protein